MRVGEEVRHALSAVFTRAEFRDPELHGLHVTVTEVRASPDLKHMTAFVSGLGKDLSPEQLKALKRAGAFLRGQVAKAVRLKYAPDLHFEPDTALGYAMHIDEVLRRPEVARDLEAPGYGGRAVSQRQHTAPIGNATASRAAARSTAG